MNHWIDLQSFETWEYGNHFKNLKGKENLKKENMKIKRNPNISKAHARDALLCQV